MIWLKRCMFINVILISLLLILPSLGQSAPTSKETIIVNDPSFPVPTRDVDNPGRHPFQRTFSSSLTGGTCTDTSSFKVQSGNRLVIEFASAQAQVVINSPTQPPQIAEVSIETVVGSDTADHRLPLIKTGTVSDSCPFSPCPPSPPPPQDRFEGSQMMRVYADPGTEVSVTTGRTWPCHGLANFSVAISGYLISAP